MSRSTRSATPSWCGRCRGACGASVATLVPEASIGELEGPEEYLFGNIRSIAVDGDRTVYVLDGQAQHIRVFDSEGTYVKTLGGPGEGPTEFTRAEAIALLPDGRLVVRDAGIKQIKVFGPGPDEVDQWPYSTSGAMLYSNTPLYTDMQGRTFQTDPGGWSPPDGFEPDQIIVLGPDGTHLDTIPEPWGDYEEPKVEWETNELPCPLLAIRALGGRPRRSTRSPASRPTTASTWPMTTAYCGSSGMRSRRGQRTKSAASTAT